MSMLNLSDLLRRKDLPQDGEAEFEAELERDMAAALALDESASFDDESDEPGVASDEPVVDSDEADEVDLGEMSPAVDPDYPTIEATSAVPPGDVLTPHAQAIMASFSVFEEANNATRGELALIGKAFTSIVTNYNLGRDFLDSGRQQIIRASELEQANARLAAENRRLLDRTEKQERMRERQDDLLESSKRREARLLQDCDNLRMTISDLRMELVELRNANSSAEHARSEMHVALAAKSAETERLTREIEVLREKLSNTTVDLEASQKRHTESRMKLDEMHTQHAAEVSKYAELNGKAATAEKEVLRLQKQCDTTEAQLKEANQALQNADHDIWERDRRHQTELQALRSEIDQLSGRLQTFAADQLERPRLAAAPEPATEDADRDLMPAIPLRPRAVAKAKASRRQSEDAA